MNQWGYTTIAVKTAWVGTFLFLFWQCFKLRIKCSGFLVWLKWSSDGLWFPRTWVLPGKYEQVVCCYFCTCEAVCPQRLKGVNYLFGFLSLCLSLSRSFLFSLCLNFSLCLLLRLSTCSLSLSFSLSLSVSLFHFLTAPLTFCLSLFLANSLSLSLSLSISIYLRSWKGQTTVLTASCFYRTKKYCLLIDVKTLMRIISWLAFRPWKAFVGSWCARNDREMSYLSWIICRNND